MIKKFISYIVKMIFGPSPALHNEFKGVHYSNLAYRKKHGVQKAK